MQRTKYYATYMVGNTSKNTLYYLEKLMKSFNNKFVFHSFVCDAVSLGLNTYVIKMYPV